MSPIKTPFGFASTAAEVAAGIDLRGRRVVVTGASSGIGAETARVLAGCGAEVTLAVRDVAAGERMAAQIAASTGRQAPRVAYLDLSRLDSVAVFAAAWTGPLHILVNNAGIMACPFEHTAEGCELQFGTNHLGHFALAVGLHGALAAAGEARIVAVSSSAHQHSPVVFEDIQFERRPYDPWQAYGQSKTANVLFAVEATRRWAGEGITANALMPGAIATKLQRHVSSQSLGSREGWKTVEQGAVTSVLLAVSPLLKGIGGRYFDDCNESEVIEKRGSSRSGVCRYALDPANAERLWQVSEALCAGKIG